MIRSTFVACLSALLLLQLAWASALPILRGPDEIEHILRVSGVALGDVLPPDTPPNDPGVLRANAALVQRTATTCTILREDLDPSVCLPRALHSDGTVEVPSAATRYLALYHLVVSPPFLIAGDANAWLLRALSGLLCAIVLAWAWTLTTVARKSLWGSAALAVAMTPAVLFATTVVAPSGLHYAGALLFWSGLMALYRVADPSPTAALSVGVGGALLATTHTTGPLWLVLVLCTWLTAVGWRVGCRLLVGQGAAGLVAGALIFVSALSTVIWVLAFASNAPGAGEPFAAETKAIGIFPHTVLWVFQTIGVMPNRFDILWPEVYALWLLPIVLLIVLGWRAASGRARAAIGLAMAASVAIPTAATVLTYEAMGVGWQGRYGLPLLFGVVILVGEVLDARRPVLSARRFRVGLMWLAATQYLCLLCLGLRESGGPYADGRPWAFLLWVAAPILVSTAYVLLARAQINALGRGGVLTRSVQPQ